MTSSMLSILAVAPFLHPGMAMAGGALVGVPILIHLLNRRRFRRIIWAAMDWLLAAQRKNARRIRIEQLILLALRCLVMLLIAMALARPILGAMGLGKLIGQERTLRIIVLDDSYSLNNSSNQTSLERGKDAVKKLLGMYADDDPVLVIQGGWPARKLMPLATYDHKAIEDALEEVAPSSRGTDLAGAVKLAVEALDADAEPSNRQVTFVSDRTRAAWQPEGEGQQNTEGNAAVPLSKSLGTLAGKAKLSFVDVGPGVSESVSNLAITELAARYSVLGTEHQIHVTATVHNFSTVVRRNLQVRLTLDSPMAGAEIRRRSGDGGDRAGMDQRTIDVPEVPAGQSVELHQTVQFADPGFHTLHAQLVDGAGDQLSDDRVAVDNQRCFSMQIKRHLNALLIDGQPMDRRDRSEVFWLSVALAPVTPGADGDAQADLAGYTLLPTVERTIRASSEWLKDQDLVVVANADLLATPDVGRVADELAEFVRRGGSLMLFLGSQTDSDASIDLYNKVFYAEGKGVMPARLLAAEGDASKREAGVSLQFDDMNHPVLEEFKAKPNPVATVRVFRYIKAELPTNSNATVLAKYTGGDPAIILSTYGAGRVALITTSADADWTNFPGKPDYLPLFNQLAYFLAPPADLSRNVAVGASISESLTSQQANTPLELIPPGNVATANAARRKAPKIAIESRSVRTADGRTVPVVDGLPFVARVAGLDQSGFYLMRVGEQTLVYASNPPAQVEGDLSPIGGARQDASDRALLSLLGKDAALLSDKDLNLDTLKAQMSSAAEVSRTLLYLVLAMCLAETILAQRFGHARE